MNRNRLSQRVACFLAAASTVAFAPPLHGQLSRVYDIEALAPAILEISSDLEDIGRVVARAGDVDGDHLDDVLLTLGTTRGAVLLVRGRQAGPGHLDPFAPPVATRIDLGDESPNGAQLAGRADVNGDGLDDILIGTSSILALVFGSADLPAEFTLDGVGGVVPGVRFGGWSGQQNRHPPVAALCDDLNGDGFAEVIVGDADFDGERGRVLVVFGGNDLPADFDLTSVGGDPSGLAVFGNIPDAPDTPGDQGDSVGQWVAGLGDIDGDGLGDLGIGGNPCVGGHVIFGSALLRAWGSLEVDGIPGAHGFRLEGMGAALPAGDWNADGLQDFTVQHGGLLSPADPPESGRHRLFVVGGRSRRDYGLFLRAADLVRDPLTVSIVVSARNDCRQGGFIENAPDDLFGGATSLLLPMLFAQDMEAAASRRGVVLVLPLRADMPREATMGELANRTAFAIASQSESVGFLREAFSFLTDFDGDGEGDLLLSAQGGRWRTYIISLRALLDPPALVLASVDPSSVDEGGGDWVRVRGSGFHPGTRFFFGGNEAEIVAGEHAGSALLRAPPRGDGPARVDVTATRGAKTVVLEQAFEYHEASVIDVEDIAAGSIEGGELQSALRAFDPESGRERAVQVLDVDAVMDVTGDRIDDVVIRWDAGADPAAGPSGQHRLASSIVFGGPHLAGKVDFAAPPHAAVLPFRAGEQNVEEPNLSRLSGSGDLDGDGTGDLTVLSWDDVPLRVFAYVLHGGAVWASGIPPRDLPRRTRIAGLPFAAPGSARARILRDLDGGGLADLVLDEGALTPEGGLHVIRGEDLLGKRDVSWDDIPRRTFGARFQSLLDVTDLDWNGDGRADLVLAASLGQRQGILVLFGGDVFRPAPGFVAIDDDLLDGGRRGILMAGQPGRSWKSLGHSLASAGDLDGDGAADLLAGDPLVWRMLGTVAAQDVGGARLIGARSLEGAPPPGPVLEEWAEATGVTPSLILDDPARPGLVALEGATRKERAGISVASAGDLNGDGVLDLAVGTASSHWLETFTPMSEEATFPSTYVIFGPAGLSAGGSLDLARGRLAGGLLIRGAGNSLAGGRDVDGDGRADLLAARLGGSVYVIPGSSVLGEARFLRGDADLSGRVEITDAVRTLGYLFLGTGELPCLDAADVDDDGRVHITDAISLLDHLFQGGPPPAPPFPEAGTDTTPGGPGCRGTP